ncbi:hypothetical protein PILCRDRAFT_13314 [Piloderma croceum F 1598]|uniref:BRCT domain-containing protein n=1 Tax=Piloderma croceum (strain F 1598) TaxID=765440 RepID=A0A0C3F7I1_PILCF|nr:hypothetical protein PILCRDRAFT_13314 [Piloderma croceum F 1598]
MSTFNAKRTRSQLTLPSLNPSVLGRSPLRDAKLAMRHAPNSQLQAHSKPRQPSKLRNNTSMDEEATDEEDEILLSPNKKLNSNRKRLSEEHELAQDENGNTRESKRAKMGPSPGPSLAHTDPLHQPSPHLEQRKMDDFQRERAVDSPRGRSAEPSVRHVDLRTASSSPWRSSSPIKGGSAVKMKPKPKDAGAMDVDATPNLTPNLTPKPPSTPRPAPSTPVSHITPSITPCTPRSQTPQGLNLGLGPGRTTGMTGPMSPLTPVPPTPALFAGGPLRAFTLGKAGGQSKPLQRERSKMNIVTTNSDSAPSTPASSSTTDATQLPHPPEHPEASSNLPTSTSNPVISTTNASTASSTSTTTITTKHPRGHSRSRSATVVSNGAGAWGPKPKTPSILKVQSMRGRGRGAVRGGRRVTRSVSMKEKVKESAGDNDGQSSGDAAGVHKSFSFTFKAPGTSTTDKSKTTNTSKKMKQMSMKDFIVGSSSSSTPTSTSTPSKALPDSGPSTGPSSPNKSKSLSTSPSKPKPAWNASAGSPFRLPPRPLKPASTLSTLSIALEKLSLPRPVRPNSSVGFNTDNGNESDAGQKGTKDDGMVGLGTSAGGAKPLKRSATVGDRSSSSRGISSTDGTATAPRLKTTAPGANEAGKFPAKVGTLPSPTIIPQVGLSVRPSGSAGNAETKNNASLDRTFKPSGLPSRGSFVHGILGSRGGGGIVVGGGGGLARKVSKKTSLPSVMASPVKGSNGSPMEEEDGIEEEPSEQADVSMRSTADILVVMNDVEEEGTGMGEKDKGKEKERPKDAWKLDASRRASMASQALTQSLSSLPRTPSKGSMGPPRTPGRAASFTYPSAASTSKGKQGEETQAGGDDTGAMGMKSAPSVLGRVRSGSDGHVGTSRSARIFAQEKEAELEAAQNEENEKGNGVLTLLNECVIFVDVRTDGGDDAGGLFVDMLKGMGARILTRVGPSCTHIVYKNGLMSTLTRYRLLQDPKPLVVGIGWVVECVEQRARVDEARFNVNLDGANVAGTNKRRRSMLPKLISGDESAETNESQEGESSRIDVSMDASEADSSMRSIDEEGLPPLEKARRRRLLLTGRA